VIVFSVTGTPAGLNVSYCRGSNIAGELGDDTFAFKLVPTAVHMP
jgi:hypothetical protein